MEDQTMNGKGGINYVRVSTLPATGDQGIRYIVEPGTTEWEFINSNWVQVEQRAPSIQYPQVLKDVVFEDLQP